MATEDEELEQLVKNLQLSAVHAGTSLQHDNLPSSSLWKCSVYLKPLIDRIIRLKTLQSTFIATWSNFGIVAISHIQSNIYLVEFDSSVNLERFLTEGPWTFQDDFILIERITPGKKIDEYLFDKLSMWVQIHNLPFDLLCPAVVINLLSGYGTMRPIDPLAAAQWRKFARLRIEFKLPFKLKAEASSQLSNGTIISGILKYERLRRFCKVCCELGHEALKCPARLRIMQAIHSDIPPSLREYLELTIQPKLTDSIKVNTQLMSNHFSTATNTKLAGNSYADSDIMANNRHNSIVSREVCTIQSPSVPIRFFTSPESSAGNNFYCPTSSNAECQAMDWTDDGYSVQKKGEEANIKSRTINSRANITQSDDVSQLVCETTLFPQVQLHNVQITAVSSIPSTILAATTKQHSNNIEVQQQRKVVRLKNEARIRRDKQPPAREDGTSLEAEIHANLPMDVSVLQKQALPLLANNRYSSAVSQHVSVLPFQSSVLEQSSKTVNARLSVPIDADIAELCGKSIQNSISSDVPQSSSQHEDLRQEVVPKLLPSPTKIQAQLSELQSRIQTSEDGGNGSKLAFDYGANNRYKSDVSLLVRAQPTLKSVPCVSTALTNQIMTLNESEFAVGSTTDSGVDIVPQIQYITSQAVKCQTNNAVMDSKCKPAGAVRFSGVTAVHPLQLHNPQAVKRKNDGAVQENIELKKQKHASTWKSDPASLMTTDIVMSDADKVATGVPRLPLHK